jgi:uncharacterized protein YwlG (UPF0340 family)
MMIASQVLVIGLPHRWLHVLGHRTSKVAGSEIGASESGEVAADEWPTRHFAVVDQALISK